MIAVSRSLCLAVAVTAAGLVLHVRAVEPAGDVVRFNFETGDLQGWQVVEGKFDYFVSDRPTYHNFPNVKYNKQGKYYLSTVEQQPGQPSNDRMTGIAESPVFVLAGPEMSFLVGGGDFPDTYVALCTLDGREVLKACGRRTEEMQRTAWNAPDLVGKKVFLRIVDRNTAGWGHVTFDDFTAQGAIDQAATGENFARAAQRRVQTAFQGRMKDVNLDGLRLAIEDLAQSFPKQYPGEAYRRRLQAYEKELAHLAAAVARGDAAVTKPAEKLLEELSAFYREALIANPLVSGQPILYVVRPQYRSHYHAIDTLFHTGEYNVDRNVPHSSLFQGGGAMKTIDLARGGEVKVLVDVPQGIARDPEVHFDGRRILFALRRNVDEDYHLWEIGADGTGLRQLTFAEGVSDFDPLYLADDTIVFSSTREPKYNQCSRDHAANLFRMEADGANIHQIERNNLFDNQASLMPDGRILYARWEYVDRNFGDAHSLWAVNPDGTNQVIYWGNNTASPAAAYTARIIPGTGRAVCIFGPHHDHLWGAMAIIDPSLGLDGREPVVRIWPPEAINLIRTGGPFDCDTFSSVRLKFADPYPLSDPATGRGAGRYFLCSRMTGRGDQMGIYLVDVFGNELLLHAEGPGCYDPMPLAPTPRPPVIPSRRDFENAEGLFYVIDVYKGTHMQGVERGTVKWLRVVEAPEKRHWSRGLWGGQGYTAPGMNWHSLENKRILGTVPVEEDGSAYIAVPSDTFVYFQLLDENGMMVQSMRSGAMVQSGERAGCIGCHDERRTAPMPSRNPTLALRRAPSRLEGWYGPPREFSFMAEVQPVFNKHCLRCHDYGKEGAKKLVLAPDRDVTFNTAYVELWRKGYTAGIGGGPAEIQQARSWGSHASKLVQVLRKGHNDVKLSPEEFDRIVTWVDLNAPYYATYACAYPEHLGGRCPLDNPQVARLSELTGVPLANLNSFATNRGPQVSFDRPELSPCLGKFQDKNNPQYKEALAIIEAGREMLAKRPRADMPGFQPCETDQKREQKYLARREIELRIRAAIREGRKVYEAPPRPSAAAAN